MPSRNRDEPVSTARLGAYRCAPLHLLAVLAVGPICHRHRIQRLLIGRVDPDHLVGLTTLVRMAERSQLEHRPSNRRDIGSRGHAEHLAPVEDGCFGRYLHRFRREVLHHLGNQRGPPWYGGASFRPVVDLRGSDACEAAKAGLGDIGPVQYCNELGVQEVCNTLLI